MPFDHELTLDIGQWLLAGDRREENAGSFAKEQQRECDVAQRTRGDRFSLSSVVRLPVVTQTNLVLTGSQTRNERPGSRETRQRGHHSRPDQARVSATLFEGGCMLVDQCMLDSRRFVHGGNGFHDSSERSAGRDPLPSFRSCSWSGFDRRSNLRPVIGRALLAFLASLAFAFCSSDSRADELSDAKDHFRHGRYDECHAAAVHAIESRRWGDDWHLLKGQCEFLRGENTATIETVQAGLQRFAWSIRLRLLGRKAALQRGDTERATAWLQETAQLAERTPWRYTDVDNLLALGEAALLFEADARDVLEAFYERARGLSAERVEPLIAIGELALSKGDLEFASDIFGQAARLSSDHPDVQLGLAKSCEEGDPLRSGAALSAALKSNPQHPPSLIYQAQRQLRREEYSAAEDWLGKVHALNPDHSEAWALKSVISLLTNQPDRAQQYREKAFGQWKQNPLVDTIIGRELAAKYRFGEAAVFLRQAVEADDDYLPAIRELSQTLLRLGHEEEGWQLVDRVHTEDGYDVVAFNLLELRDELAQFRTLTGDGVIVRMAGNEAAICGPRVVELLERARGVLCAKYQTDLEGPVTVEIFPNPNDFAVRTFGMPAVSGYLGVCFGRVITANSPASQAGSPTNWQAVLWHEFCHAVTLEATSNRMPRWLSEGISVYEESQADPTWGQQMAPRYRQMILEGELTPVGQLSGAFMSPPSALHLQFAYYESSLVVQFLIERFGMDSLLGILQDLRRGLAFNEALERNTDGLEAVEEDFAEYAKNLAENYGSEVDWADHNLTAVLSDDDPQRLARWVGEHPNHLASLDAYAAQLQENGDIDSARDVLRKRLALLPDDVGSASAAAQLAKLERRSGRTEAEREILQYISERSDDLLDVELRLMDLAEAAGQDESLCLHARKALAIQPMLPAVLRKWAMANERLGRTEDAIQAWRAVLAASPDDLAETHYRLACLLHERKESSARDHVLHALEEAPRFLAAHRLLLKINAMSEIDAVSKTSTAEGTQAAP